MSDNEEEEDILWSPTNASPKLRFGGDVGALGNLADRMNQTLSELKEGRYEIKKGHEAVQQLQNKLGRLQDTFEENIEDVQTSLVEHAAFYATNPVVLGGMVKLAEVLGLAHVLLGQKNQGMQEVIHKQLQPLLQKWENQVDLKETTIQELQFYREKVHEAVKKGRKYEEDITVHLRDARDRMQIHAKKEIERKCGVIRQQNRELARKVRQLEFQNKKLRERELHLINMGGGGIPGGGIAGEKEFFDPRDEMLHKMGEIENILAVEDQGLITPMIKDACSYLRTLLKMKDDDPDLPLTHIGNASAPGTIYAPQANKAGQDPHAHEPLWHNQAPDTARTGGSSTRDLMSASNNHKPEREDVHNQEHPLTARSGWSGSQDSNNLGANVSNPTRLHSDANIANVSSNRSNPTRLNSDAIYSNAMEARKSQNAAHHSDASSRNRKSHRSGISQKNANSTVNATVNAGAPHTDTGLFAATQAKLQSDRENRKNEIDLIRMSQQNANLSDHDRATTDQNTSGGEATSGNHTTGSRRGHTSAYGIDPYAGSNPFASSSTEEHQEGVHNTIASPSLGGGGGNINDLTQNNLQLLQDGNGHSGNANTANPNSIRLSGAAEGRHQAQNPVSANSSMRQSTASNARNHNNQNFNHNNFPPQAGTIVSTSNSFRHSNNNYNNPHHQAASPVLSHSIVSGISSGLREPPRPTGPPTSSPGSALRSSLRGSSNRGSPGLDDSEIFAAPRLG